MDKIKGNYEEVKKQMIELYKGEEICMEELLGAVNFEDLSAEDTFNMYMELLSIFENDIFIRVNKEDKICEILR